MDFFGIGQAVRGIIEIYFRMSRCTGRTSSLIEGVKDGDTVCFTNNREANRVNNLFKDRGVKVECIVVNPKKPDELFHFKTSKGRMIFDHSWVEQYYILAIENCQKDITMLERESSGFGEVHRETYKKAFETVNRFRF